MSRRVLSCHRAGPFLILRIGGYVYRVLQLQEIRCRSRSIQQHGDFVTVIRLPISILVLLKILPCRNHLACSPCRRVSVSNTLFWRAEMPCPVTLYLPHIIVGKIKFVRFFLRSCCRRRLSLYYQLSLNCVCIGVCHNDISTHISTFTHQEEPSRKPIWHINIIAFITVIPRLKRFDQNLKTSTRFVSVLA